MPAPLKASSPHCMLRPLPIFQHCSIAASIERRLFPLKFCALEGNLVKAYCLAFEPTPVHKRFQTCGCNVQDFPELWAQKGLPKRLRRNVAACGFVDPTPIQRQAIPLLLAGQEVLAVAPTGAALGVLSLQHHRSGRSGDRQEEACCFRMT